MILRYILDDKGNPVPEPSLTKWAQWFEHFKLRWVAETTLGDTRISTVFLGTDHRFIGEGPPILWETMVFGGSLDHEQDRCSGTREQAEAMHEAMVARVHAVLALKEGT
jgi:hypothetical protein